jgi:hypothetical protein
MKRLLGWVFVVVAGAAATLVGAGAPACACSCVGATEAESYERADAVFAATLVKRDEPGGMFSSDDPVELGFTVDAVYKGDVSAVQRVVTERSTASCGLEVEVGKRYLVHADSTDGELTASLCGGTRTLTGTPPVVAGHEPRAAAGGGEPRETPGGGESREAAGGGGGEPVWPLFAGGALLVLALAGAGYAIVRRVRGDHGTADPRAV